MVLFSYSDSPGNAVAFGWRLKFGTLPVSTVGK